MTGARVGAVVLNYNGGERTLACLRSVLATEGDVPLRVVLVDNASTDGIAARVRTELPAVTVVESPTNRGFAGGCNLGIRSLPDVRFVALVNNDATVDPGWLTPRVEALMRAQTRRSILMGMTGRANTGSRPRVAISASLNPVRRPKASL